MSRELRVASSESPAYSRAWRLAPRNSQRRAISLIEVLISMFVLLFGLMGVAAIFPVGNHFVVEGEKFDLGSAMAQNAFEELKARGLLRPEFWHYPDPVGNLTANGVTASEGTLEYNSFVMQPNPLLLNGPLNLNRGTFNLVGSFGSGHAFVIDPIGAASGIELNLPNLDLFPLSYLGSPDLDNPWFTSELSGQPGERVPLSGARWPVRRVTVLDANSWIRTAVAETICRLRDDLAVDQPDESDVPSRQLWRTADVDLGGNANGTLDDPVDDQLLLRQFKGDYSWLATVVPTSDAGLQALQPADENYGEIACDLSVVVFRKRDFTPSNESENRINAELLAGGELVVYSPKSNADDAKDDVDQALKDIRPGTWMTLMGVDQSSGQLNPTIEFGRFVMKWYRILAFDTDENATQQIELERIGGSNITVVGRRLMLAGPDWPQVPNPNNAINGPLPHLPYVPNLRAGFFPGAISVVTKPIRMEHSSLWSLEQ